MWRLLSLLVLAPHVAGEVDEEKSPEAVEPSWWDALYAESETAGVKDFNDPWLGLSFKRLKEALGDRIAPHQDLSVVLLGSGDSRLPQELLRSGFGRVTAVDFSEKAAALFQSAPGIEWIKEDARSQTSLPASAFDLVVELGTLDTVSAAKDAGEGAAGLVREARRLLRGGGKYVSASMDSPVFRLPLLAKHPAGGWTGQAEVLRLPRPHELDPRVKELNPDWEVDNLFLYVSTAAGQVEVPQPRARLATEVDMDSPETASATDPEEESSPGLPPAPPLIPAAQPPPAPPNAPDPAPPVPATESESSEDSAEPDTSSQPAPPLPPEAPATPEAPAPPEPSQAPATPEAPAPPEPIQAPATPPSSEQNALPPLPPAPPAPPKPPATAPAQPPPRPPAPPPPAPRPPLPLEDLDSNFDPDAPMTAEALAAAAAAAEAAYAEAMAAPEDQAQASALAAAAAYEAEAAAAAAG